MSWLEDPCGDGPDEEADPCPFSAGRVHHARVDDAAAGERLDRFLADAVPDLSRSRLKGLIRDGAVTDADGAAWRDPARKVAAGTAFVVAIPDPVPARPAAQPMALSIIYEDTWIAVIDKPAGLVVHPAAGNPDKTLVNGLLAHFGDGLSGIGGVQRPGIVHRLDRDTTGLIVVAKTEAAHGALAAQFADRTLSRRYLAVVRGVPVPGQGRVDAAIGRHPRQRQKMAVVAGGKRAVTHYRLVRPLTGAALLDCRLETGRTHQIRVHLTHIGHPLIGDPVYGRPARTGDPEAIRTFSRQALHAAALTLRHPADGRAMAFEAPMPTDLETLIAALSSRA